MRYVHLTLGTRGRMAFATNEGQRRALVLARARTARERLLLFCLVDEHLHAVLQARRERYLARDLARSFRAVRPGLQLEEPHLKPVEDKGHLKALVRYFLIQPIKHDLPMHPALWSGSSLLDLVGARVLPGFSRGPLRAELPRLRQGELFEMVGLQPAGLAPASDECLRRVGAGRLAELAARVHLARPDLRGRAEPERLARATAARVGLAVGVTAGDLAHYLRLQPKSVYKTGRRILDEQAGESLRLLSSLEDRVHSRRG